MRSGSDKWVITRIHNQLTALHNFPNNADVRQNCASTIIKKEVEDDRYSPVSTGSYSSGVSVPHMSGPGGYNIERHQHHQQRIPQHVHRPQLTLRYHQHLQQQSRHQLASSLLMGRPLSSPSTSGTDLSELLQQATPAGYLLPCPLCDIPLEPRLFRQHLDRHYPRDSPVCPVLQCGRRFAHPNSVRNHMRIKHTLQWAKMKAMRSSGGPFSSIPDFK